MHKVRNNIYHQNVQSKYICIYEWWKGYIAFGILHLMKQYGIWVRRFLIRDRCELAWAGIYHRWQLMKIEALEIYIRIQNASSIKIKKKNHHIDNDVTMSIIYIWFNKEKVNNGRYYLLGKWVCNEVDFKVTEHGGYRSKFCCKELKMMLIISG